MLPTVVFARANADDSVSNAAATEFDPGSAPGIDEIQIGLPVNIATGRSGTACDRFVFGTVVAP